MDFLFSWALRDLAWILHGFILETEAMNLEGAGKMIAANTIEAAGERKGKQGQASSLLFDQRFFLFWFGQAIAQIGDGINRVALLWFVYKLTGSAFKMALVGALETIPVIAFGMVAGAFLDRHNKKWTIVGTNLFRAGVTLAIPVLFWMKLLSFPALCFCVALISAASAFFGPAVTASIPLMVSRERLNEGNSLLYATIHAGLLLGPAFAGVIIPITGAPKALGLTACGLLISGLCLLPLKIEEERPRKKPCPQSGQLLGDMFEGLWFVLREDRLILSVMIVALAYNFSLNPLPLVFSAFSERVFGGGARVMGMMMSGFGAGALLTSFFLAGLKKDLGGRPTLGVLLGLAGVVLVIMGHSHSLVFACLLAVLTGSCASTMGVLFLTILQKRSPAPLLGRTLATFNAITQAATPLGMLAAGCLLDSKGIAGTA